MSGKELSKLVAFVKGTQFDLVVSFTFLSIPILYLLLSLYLRVAVILLQEYLQRERYGSARLDDFASGLELIGHKVVASRNYLVNFIKHAMLFFSFLILILFITS